MAEQASTAVAIHSSRDVSTLDEFDELLLTGKRVELLDDPETMQRAILEQLLAATSDEELEPADPIGWRTLIGVPIELHSFSWRPSDFDEESSSNIYVIVRGRNLLDGSAVTLTTGARNVLAQLSNLARRDRFPTVRAIKESEKATKRGYVPLWLYTPEGYVVDVEPVEESDD